MIAPNWLTQPTACAASDAHTDGARRQTARLQVEHLPRRARVVGVVFDSDSELSSQSLASLPA
jgi:hypothetical protein